MYYVKCKFISIIFLIFAQYRHNLCTGKIEDNVH